MVQNLKIANKKLNAKLFIRHSSRMSFLLANKIFVYFFNTDKFCYLYSQFPNILV